MAATRSTKLVSSRSLLANAHVEEEGLEPNPLPAGAPSAFPPLLVPSSPIVLPAASIPSLSPLPPSSLAPAPPSSSPPLPPPPPSIPVESEIETVKYLLRLRLASEFWSKSTTIRSRQPYPTSDPSPQSSPATPLELASMRSCRRETSRQQRIRGLGSSQSSSDLR